MDLSAEKDISAVSHTEEPMQQQQHQQGHATIESMSIYGRAGNISSDAPPNRTFSTRAGNNSNDSARYQGSMAARRISVVKQVTLLIIAV